MSDPNHFNNLINKVSDEYQSDQIRQERAIKNRERNRKIIRVALLALLFAGLGTAGFYYKEVQAAAETAIQKILPDFGKDPRKSAEESAKKGIGEAAQENKKREGILEDLMK